MNEKTTKRKYEISFLNTIFEKSILIKNLYLNLFAKKKHLFISEFHSTLINYENEKIEALNTSNIIFIYYLNDENLKEILSEVNKKAIIIVIHKNNLANVKSNISYFKDDINSLGEILFYIEKYLSKDVFKFERKEANFLKSNNNKVLKDFYTYTKFNKAIDKSDRIRLEFFKDNKITNYEQAYYKKKLNFNNYIKSLKMSDLSIATVDLEYGLKLFDFMLDRKSCNQILELYDILTTFSKKEMAMELSNRLYNYILRNLSKKELNKKLLMFFASFKVFSKEDIEEYKNRHLEFADKLRLIKCYDASISVLEHLEKFNNRIFMAKWILLLDLYKITDTKPLALKAVFKENRNQISAPFLFGYETNQMFDLIESCCYCVIKNYEKRAISLFNTLMPLIPLNNNNDYAQFLYSFAQTLMKKKMHIEAKEYLFEAFYFDMTNVKILEDIMLCKYHTTNLDDISIENLNNDIIYFFMNMLNQ